MNRCGDRTPLSTINMRYDHMPDFANIEALFVGFTSSTIGSTERKDGGSRKVSLEFDLTGLAFEDLLESAKNSWKIRWQGQMRRTDALEDIEEGATVKLNAKGFVPGVKTKDPVGKTDRMLAGLPEDQRDALIAKYIQK